MDSRQPPGTTAGAATTEKRAASLEELPLEILRLVAARVGGRAPAAGLASPFERSFPAFSAFPTGRSRESLGALAQTSRTLCAAVRPLLWASVARSRPGGPPDPDPGRPRVAALALAGAAVDDAGCIIGCFPCLIRLSLSRVSLSLPCFPRTLTSLTLDGCALDTLPLAGLGQTCPALTSFAYRHNASSKNGPGGLVSLGACLQGILARKHLVALALANCLWGSDDLPTAELAVAMAQCTTLSRVLLWRVALPDPVLSAALSHPALSAVTLRNLPNMDLALRTVAGCCSSLQTLAVHGVRRARQPDSHDLDIATIIRRNIGLVQVDLAEFTQITLSLGALAEEQLDFLQDLSIAHAGDVGGIELASLGSVSANHALSVLEIELPSAQYFKRVHGHPALGPLPRLDLMAHLCWNGALGNLTSLSLNAINYWTDVDMVNVIVSTPAMQRVALGDFVPKVHGVNIFPHVLSSWPRLATLQLSCFPAVSFHDLFAAAGLGQAQLSGWDEEEKIRPEPRLLQFLPDLCSLHLNDAAMDFSSAI